MRSSRRDVRHETLAAVRRGRARRELGDASSSRPPPRSPPTTTRARAHASVSRNSASLRACALRMMGSCADACGNVVRVDGVRPCVDDGGDAIAPVVEVERAAPTPAAARQPPRDHRHTSSGARGARRATGSLSRSARAISTHSARTRTPAAARSRRVRGERSVATRRALRAPASPPRGRPTGDDSTAARGGSTSRPSDRCRRRRRSGRPSSAAWRAKDADLALVVQNHALTRLLEERAREDSPSDRLKQSEAGLR